MLKKILSHSPFGIDSLAIIRVSAGILMLIHGKVVFDSQIMQGMGESLSKDMGLPFPLLMARIWGCLFHC